MGKVILRRNNGDQNQTTGILIVEDDNGRLVFVSPCIERGYRDNRKNISNVPAGEYPLILDWSPKFKKYLWELVGVPGRIECKIHSANYWRQLNGCIALGLYLTDFNGDDYQDVGASRKAMKAFHKVMSKLFANGISSIKIIDPF
jgi:hypothetical protein